MVAENDSKWSQFNKIAKGGIHNKKHKVRNTYLKKNTGGLTHDFGSSLSSQERKRKKTNVKNHKLSWDSSLLKNRTDCQKFSASPAPKCKRRQIKGSLVNQQKVYGNRNLESFLDNHEGISNIKTKEFYQTDSNKVRDIFNPIGTIKGSR